MPTADNAWVGAQTTQRILMLAPCVYPSPLGTAVCIRQLAQSLAARGHTLHIVTYASAGHKGVFQDGLTTCHAVAGTEVLARSGPQSAKAPADWRLWCYARRLGKTRQFDLVYAHHVEGMLLGLALRPVLDLPLIGHVHTRIGFELPCYLSAGLRRHAAAFLGHLADRALPWQLDAVVTLNAADAAVCRRYAPKDSVFVRYPQMPSAKRITSRPALCAFGANVPQGYAIYSGNADGYQNLALLCRAAHTNAWPLVIATHSEQALFDVHAWPKTTRIVQVDNFEQMQFWLQGASVGVCPRVQVCGYPVKWLNYWQAGLSVVAIEDVGRAVFGAQLNTDVHGPACWVAPTTSALACAIGAQVSCKQKASWRAPDGEQCFDCIFAQAHRRHRTNRFKIFY